MQDMMQATACRNDTGKSADIDLDAYHRDGFMVLPDLFTPDICDNILSLATQLPHYQDGSLAPTMMPHRLVPALLDMIAAPPLVAVMDRVLGGQAMGLQTQFFFGRPGIRGFTAHQDNFYVEAPRDAFASAWLALDDVDAENGGLIVYPGSHHEPVLPVRPVAQETTFGQDPNANNQECVIPGSYQPINVSVRRGSVIIIHGHVIHASNNNSSTDRLRRVLLMTYVRDGAPYRAGFLARREAFSVRYTTSQC